MTWSLRHVCVLSVCVWVCIGGGACANSCSFFKTYLCDYSGMHVAVLQRRSSNWMWKSGFRLTYARRGAVRRNYGLAGVAARLAPCVDATLPKRPKSHQWAKCTTPLPILPTGPLGCGAEITFQSGAASCFIKMPCEQINLCEANYLNGLFMADMHACISLHHLCRCMCISL